MLVESHVSNIDMCRLAEDYENSEVAQLGCSLSLQKDIPYTKIDIRYTLLPLLMDNITKNATQFDARYYCFRRWKTALEVIMTTMGVSDSQLLNYMCDQTTVMLTSKFASETTRMIKMSSILMDMYTLCLIIKDESDNVIVVAGVFHSLRIADYLLLHCKFTKECETFDRTQCVRVC